MVELCLQRDGLCLSCSQPANADDLIKFSLIIDHHGLVVILFNDLAKETLVKKTAN
jgi:hypothetical protein